MAQRPPGADSAPTFWIIAGPNGSGKSSFYSQSEFVDFDRSVWIINPDLLTARISSVEKLPLRDANLAAVQRIEKWLDASIDAHQTVGVETVLSTNKYRRIATAAKARGYFLRLTYVILKEPALNIRRVAARVEKGGHDVPVDKIEARWHKSLQQLPWFLNAADTASIYDNSTTPRRILLKQDGVLYLDQNALPEIVTAAHEVERIAGNDPAPKTGLRTS
jgi:predicted ABC-type ATPase